LLANECTKIAVDGFSQGQKMRAQSFSD
jgi:hypothetical protein